MTTLTGPATPGIDGPSRATLNGVSIDSVTVQSWTAGEEAGVTAAFMADGKTLIQMTRPAALSLAARLIAASVNAANGDLIDSIRREVNDLAIVAQHDPAGLQTATL